MVKNYFWLAKCIKGNLKSGIVDCTSARQALEYAKHLAGPDFTIVKLELIE